MLKTHAVGIDLGTTYSCIAYLNEHGQPVTLANQEGELQTPSVVLIDESGEIVVGTEAWRNAVVRPDRVIENSKRYMGDPKKHWTVDGRRFTPPDVASLILKKLLAAAESQIGKVEQAVITVPAQFSEIQRQETVRAGLQAGLKRVDIINEPVAAALCYVLGTEGLWFTELADAQRVLVYDLGGGTFDLSLVKYQANEVKVIASSGDLNLGGIDWNRTLLDAIAQQFVREFKVDPRMDPHSLQFLSLEVENAKRSLTVRPKTALTCQHEGHRKSYQVEQPQFEKLTEKLVERTCELTQKLLKDNKLGWAHVDVILTVGGSSRMPMIRNALKSLGGRTLNTSLSPDLSIAHGATYYAGMLLTNNEFARSILNEEAAARLSSIKQQSVNSRGLGILVRDEADNRIPHYLIPANTSLPAAVSQTFGTVVPNQKRVHLRIVESGTAADQQYVELGTCIIENLPEKLPENSQVEVTIRYDEQARVHVSARDVTSGLQASTEIVREESLVRRETSAQATGFQSDALMPSAGTATAKSTASTASSTVVSKAASAVPEPVSKAASAGSGSTTAARPSTAVGGSSAASVKAAPAPKPTVATSKSAVNPTPSKPPASKEPASSAGVRKPSLADSALQAAVADVLRDMSDEDLEEPGRPVPLCNDCGEPLDHRGQCPQCPPKARPVPGPKPASGRAVSKTVPPGTAGAKTSSTASSSKPVAKSTSASKPAGTVVVGAKATVTSQADSESQRPRPAAAAPVRATGNAAAAPPQPRRENSTKPADSKAVAAPAKANAGQPDSGKPPSSSSSQHDAADMGEDEFWKLINDE